MKEYHKIETLYERDEKTKKLIMGKFRNETVEYLKDNKWVFTEKIDGTNVRVFWDGHKVTFSGRTDTSQMPSHLMNKLFELFGGEINEQMFEQKFGETSVMLYGEGYGVKIQNGGLYRSDVSFILFDVEIDGLFLKREAVEDVAKYFLLEIVPIVCVGTIQDGVDFVLDSTKSMIGTAIMEGVVGRTETELFDRRGDRVIVKIKRKDFS